MVADSRHAVMTCSARCTRWEPRTSRPWRVSVSAKERFTRGRVDTVVSRGGCNGYHSGQIDRIVGLLTMALLSSQTNGLSRLFRKETTTTTGMRTSQTQAILDDVLTAFESGGRA